VRCSETANSTTRQLTWDVSSGLPFLIGDGTTDVVNGPEGLPVEQINTSTSTVYYYHHNRLGSTVMLTNSANEVAAHYEYAASGVQTQTLASPSASAPLGYAGQLEDDETGLVYMRAREYDPATAQFISVDPLAAQTSEPYSYAEDNPLNFTDFTGDSCSILDLGSYHECEEKAESWLSKEAEQGVEDVNEGLSDIHEGASDIAFGAAACDLVTVPSVIGDFGPSEACAVVGGAAETVTATTGSVLYLEGRESLLGAALGNLGAVFSKLGDLPDLSQKTQSALQYSGLASDVAGKLAGGIGGGC
jgi:RHS repeat-associated protein